MFLNLNFCDVCFSSHLRSLGDLCRMTMSSTCIATIILFPFLVFISVHGSDCSGLNPCIFKCPVKKLQQRCPA